MADSLPAAEPLRVRAAQIGMFETPVLHGRIADCEPLNAALAAAIAGHRAANPGIARSNIGGWHSHTDMLDWGGAPARAVSDAAIRMARRISFFEGREGADIDWTMRMWANVSPPGALNTSHAHPGVLWAAVYYVDMGAAPGEAAGGELYFEDPRFPVTVATFPGFRAIGIDGEPQPVERSLPTEAGDMVLFPGFVRHGVRPNGGSRDRISIAMNLYARAPD